MLAVGLTRHQTSVAKNPKPSPQHGAAENGESAALFVLWIKDFLHCYQFSACRRRRMLAAIAIPLPRHHAREHMRKQSIKLEIKYSLVRRLFGPFTY
jgi:hypothetical protein